ncbi:hemolysin family protein [Actinomyces massiliensis]|uniref:Membrane protein, PF01595 family n=1 Tax=Actinomyces massiliensis F0489 TaxID=1125718 RepID=J0MNC6_9ACTO|nr:hemolysin family protein [Actinomyces massiliensis]EJF35714.1 membrane protein, PF01595 family [Actinomyces massiliensis F0489]WLD70894.1 hemolysin family protein [Actinomyces massiliensis]
MSTPVALIVTVALLAGNAFFVGSEFAITSSRRAQLEPLAQAGDARAVTALWALQHISRMLATAQLGVTVCSTGLGVVAEPAIAHALTPLLARIGIADAGAHAVAVVIALVLVVYVHVVFAEMVPKNMSIAAPERAVRLLAPPLVWVSRVFGPVITGLNGFANRVLHVMGLEAKEEVSAAFNAAEVASIVERSTAEGVLEDDTGLLTGALEFSEETAGSVMVPLDALVTLAENCRPEDVEQAVAATGFSRFPLVAVDAGAAGDGDGGDADGAGESGARNVHDANDANHANDASAATNRITGYLHLKDILYADGAQRSEPIPSWHARTLVPVRADDEVEDVLAAMQRTGAHLGRVEDADGVTVGVVFLEDILEELVGEVNDAMQRS